MGRVGACPHLIGHRYAWHFFVGCGREFGGFIFLCEGRPPKTLSLFNASKAVALVDAGNSSHAHGERCSREMSTLFSWRIARFWFAEVFFFDLFPSFALFAQTVLCVTFGLLPRLRGAAPQTPRKPSGGGLDRPL